MHTPKQAPGHYSAPENPEESEQHIALASPYTLFDAASKNVTEYIAKESTYDHALMVAKITEIMTRRLGWDADASKRAGQAAVLHDIGKNFIPQEILNKPGRLTAEEYTVVKTHAGLGFEYLVSQIQILFLAAILSLQHHENINGSGYLGMTDEQIYPLAKLVAVADVFDALFSKRPYKEAWSPERTIAQLKEDRGELFEPKYVDLILASLDEVLALYKSPDTQEPQTSSAGQPLFSTDS
jgi:uncharacterized domain HDIG